MLRCGVNLEQGQKILITGDVAARLPDRRPGRARLRLRRERRRDPLLRRPGAGRQGRRRARPTRWPPRVPGLVRGRLPDRDRRALGAHPHPRRPHRRPLRRRPGRARDRAADGGHRCPPTARSRRASTGACAACPTPAWARRIYGEPDVARLWRDLRFAVRLDEPDPVAAWSARRDELALARARSSTRRASSALRFRGGGTDLFVPLHGDAHWQPAWLTTSWGRRVPLQPAQRGDLRRARLPGRERHGRRDPAGHGERRAGHRPRPALRRRPHRRGAAPTATPTPCAPASTRTPAPAGWARWRWSTRRRGSGELGTVFKETLLDENAACHIAWGAAIHDSFPDGLPEDPAALEARGVNESDVHQDVMIGGPDVAVTGVTRRRRRACRSWSGSAGRSSRRARPSSLGSGRRPAPRNCVRCRSAYRPPAASSSSWRPRCTMRPSSQHEDHGRRRAPSRGGGR